MMATFVKKLKREKTKFEMAFFRQTTDHLLHLKINKSQKGF